RGRQLEGEGLGLAHHAAQSWRVRPGSHPSRRPRHHHPARLAPGRHEHRGAVEGYAERGLPRLKWAGYPEKKPVAATGCGGLRAFRKGELPALATSLFRPRGAEPARITSG